MLVVITVMVLCGWTATTADHWNHRENSDYSLQPLALLRLKSTVQQQLLFTNAASSIGDAPRAIQIRHIGNCLKAAPAYGAGIAKASGIPLGDVPK